MAQQLPKAQALFDKRKQFVPNAQSIFHPSTGVSASNATIIDADGRELIDFAGGIGVVNSGHCPPPVVKAIQEQAAQMIHACFAVTVHKPYLDLCEELSNLFPHGDKGTKVIPTNCGAEAVENAIKIARIVTQRPAIIAFEGAFHGRTYGALSLTSKTAIKKSCGPMLPEVYRLEFPYYGKKAQRMFKDEQAFADYHIERLHHLFTYHVGAQYVAGIMIETVQGEGGFNPVSKLYLKELRKITQEKGIMLILDEIQSGFGRTGKWAAYQHYDVVPDLSTWGKSIGGGMPVGCVIANAEIVDRAEPGLVGGTYLGNPVCVAAALANIRYMKEININALSEKVASIVQARFQHIQKEFPQFVGEIKGLGAMQAIEFVNKDGSPATDFTKNIVENAWQNGLLVITAGTHSNHIRMLSPLTIPLAQLEKGLDILENAIRESVKAIAG